MPTTVAISEVLSSLGSNQSGLASLSDDDAQGQVCPATSQISAGSGTSTLKVCDYMGQSEVSSAPPHMAISRDEWHKKNAILEETELSLGPSKALPSSQRADNGAPFQPNVVSFLPTAGERKNENSVLPNEHHGILQTYHTCNVLEELKDYGEESGAPEVEKDEKSKQLRRHAEDLDLAIGLFPDSLPYPCEEVGENKLSSGSGETEQQFCVKLMKQCLEHVSLTKKNHRGCVGSTKNAMEEIELQKYNAITAFERLMTEKLREVTTPTKYCQSHTTFALTDAANCLKRHEVDLTEHISALQEFNVSKVSSLPSIAGASNLVDALKTPLIRTKRVFTEAFGVESVVNNPTSRIGMYANANAESESNVYGGFSLPPLFPWNSNKQSVASWAPKVEHPGKGFGSFTSTGQSVGYLSPEYQFSTFLEWSVGQRLSNTEFVNASESSDADDASVTAPRTTVGWPPVQSFRKNSLPPPHPKNTLKNEATAPHISAETKIHGQPKCSYVKVYMDGLPIGRKVGLHIHDSYDKLNLVLANMFKHFMGGNFENQNIILKEMMASSLTVKMKFFSGSKYVLTYEDKDGDLMLVGDVPWRMFTLSVKRLRIMKGSEAIGLAPEILKETKP